MGIRPQANGPQLQQFSAQQQHYQQQQQQLERRQPREGSVIEAEGRLIADPLKSSSIDFERQSINHSGVVVTLEAKSLKQSNCRSEGLWASGRSRADTR